MYRPARAVLMIAVFLFATGTVFAQRNPRGTSKLSLNGKDISVEYGRPSLKGRTVEQMLERLKPGDFWRLGADTSTTFSTAADLAFGDATVPKGEYSLWAQKEADGWKLVFNKQHGQWGTQHDPAQDLAAAPLTEEKAKKPAEMLTIEFAKLVTYGPDGKWLSEDQLITIQWGEMVLSAKFAAK